MRRFAISFGAFVVVVVGILNLINAKFPDALGRLRRGDVVPASAPQTTSGSGAPTAASESSSTVARPQPVPLAEEGTPGLYPGARIDRIVYGARPYVDMTVVSVSNQTVVLRNDREIVSIPTGSLPADFRQMAIAYLEGSDTTPARRAGNPAFPKSTIVNAATTGTSPQPPPSRPGPAMQDPVPDMESLVWQAAHDRAEKWLRFERKRRPTDIVPLLTGVDLKSPLPMSGLPGYWKVRGRGYVATYQSEKGGTFHDFEVTIVLNAQGEVLRADIDIL